MFLPVSFPFLLYDITLLLTVSTEELYMNTKRFFKSNNYKLIVIFSNLFVCSILIIAQDAYRI